MTKKNGELLAVTHVSLFAAAHKMMSRRCYLAGAVSAKKSTYILLDLCVLSLMPRTNHVRQTVTCTRYLRLFIE